MTDQERFDHGIQLFNSRDFFACHDVWEELWMDSRGPERTLYQGLIQVAVAYYHAGNGNFRGAASLMRKGTGKLRAHVGTQPAGLRKALPVFERHGTEFLRRIEEGGHFDPSDIPTLS